MKIIKKGIVPSDKPWWTQVQIRCKCGCIFMLDESDTVSCGNAMETSISYPCPTCHKELWFQKPTESDRKKKESVYQELFGETGILFENLFGNIGKK